MKKLIPLMVLLAGVSGALAQGVVDFRNNQADFPTAANRDVFMPGGLIPVVGTNFQARLLYGTDVGSLTAAIYTVPARFRAITTGALNAGAWNAGTQPNRTLVNFTADETVTLVVQVWDAGPGAGLLTFEDAVAQGGLYGSSAPFTYVVPATGSFFTAFYMDNFRSFSLVPEPSVIGLGLIGAGALFLLRRRKA